MMAELMIHPSLKSGFFAECESLLRKKFVFSSFDGVKTQNLFL